MVPEALKSRTQWLVWRYESKVGQKKPAKMPYYASGARRTGKQGDAADRNSLTTFDFAMEVKSRGTRSESTREIQKYDGIGFAFLPGDGLVGVDLDHVVDEKTGVISERAMQMIKACASFAEYSPSKLGVHIYALGQTESFKSNHVAGAVGEPEIGVEVFCGRQFFTVTGEHFAGTPEVVNAIDDKTLRRLRATVDQAKAQGAKQGGKPGSAASAKSAAPMDQRSKVESALAVIPANCSYDEWIEIGMAVQAELGDAGFSVWDYWSSKDSKYPGPRGSNGTETHWKSFKPGGGITGATLFKRAKEAGWRAPKGARARPDKAPSSDVSPARQKAAAAGGAGSPPGDDPPATDDDAGHELPTIRWIAGKLPAVVDAAEAALLNGGGHAKDGERLFQRDRMLARVMRRSSHTVRSYRRPPGTLSIVMVDTPYLVEAFTRVARWEKWDGRALDWRRCNAPEQAATTYLSRAGHWKLPHLASAISAPTLRPDGTILQNPGYDAATRCWYDPGSTVFPEVPDKPTREQAVAALELLSKWLSTFPFEQEMDRSVAMSLALCGLVRRSLPAAPLGAISAPVMASGKTLLADCIAILATGASAPAMTYAQTDEEAQKTALAVLAEGDAVVLIDNVERPLQGDWLCSILTSETYSQRVLGRTEMIRVPTTTLILATGNHLVIAGDLRTRSLMCRIDPKVERPEERKFERDLREWMMEHRPALVAAGLTVMRALVVERERIQSSGEAMPEIIAPWGRFEHWSAMVRAPLVWLGMTDPCESIKALEDEDPDRNEHLRLMTEWVKVFGDKGMTAREAIEEAELSGLTSGKPSVLMELFREIASDRNGAVKSKRLAKWLQRYAGRRARGQQIVKAGEEAHSTLWKVETIGKTGAKASGSEGKVTG